MNDRLRQILVLVLAIAQLVISTLSSASNVFSIDGSGNVGAISDSLRTYFTPADYAFAVWGVIFLGVIVYGVYQALPSQRTREVHRSIAGWVMLTVIINTAWTLVFIQSGLRGTENFRPGVVLVTAFMIVAILFGLLQIYLRLRRLDASLTRADRWLVTLPWSLFFAWVTVATVANWAIAGLALGWEGQGIAEIIAVGLVAVAVAITSAVVWVSRAHVGLIGYTGVVIWALVAVAVGNQDQSQLVPVAGFIGAAVVGVVTLIRLSRGNRGGESAQLMPARA
jgi:hypothetical protein